MEVLAGDVYSEGRCSCEEDRDGWISLSNRIEIYVFDYEISAICILMCSLCTCLNEWSTAEFNILDGALFKNERGTIELDHRSGFE